MKRVLFLALALVMALCFVACNVSGEPVYDREGLARDYGTDDGILDTYDYDSKDIVGRANRYLDTHDGAARRSDVASNAGDNVLLPSNNTGR